MIKLKALHLSSCSETPDGICSLANVYYTPWDRVVFASWEVCSVVPPCTEDNWWFIGCDTLTDGQIWGILGTSSLMQVAKWKPFFILAVRGGFVRVHRLCFKLHQRCQVSIVHSVWEKELCLSMWLRERTVCIKLYYLYWSCLSYPHLHKVLYIHNGSK